MSAATAKKATMIDSKRYTTLRPIPRNLIPLGRGRGHGKNLTDLVVYKEFNERLEEICRFGISPYEVADEIDTQNPEIVMEKSKRKSFVQSFRNLLKDSIKKHGLNGKVDIREYNNGERFFLVGREA